MPVTSDSYDAKVSEAVVNLVAGSAAFRTMVSAANPTAALSFIVEDWSGIDDDAPSGAPKASNGTTLVITNGYAVVRVSELLTERRALGTFGRSGTVDVAIMVPTTAADTPAENFRRARNAQGTIREQIQAQIGGATTLLWADVRADPIQQMDDTTAMRGFYFCPIIIDWSDLP